jgi:3',5'-cyclic-AMP phosphodiesterase
MVMAPPLTVVQLSDPHLGALWGGADPLDRLAATVGHVRAMRPHPDAVLVSGDLADNAEDAEYEQLAQVLGEIGAPVYVLPGNHDDRAGLRRHFDLDGTSDAPVQYAVDLEELRLVVLDTKRDGADGGQLDSDRLAWLDSALDVETTVTTLIAMHHPPITTGIPAMDAIGLPVADRDGLRDVVARHPQVKRLVGGHVHRAIAGEFAGRAVLAAPSTYVQLELDFQTSGLSFSADPPGFAVHLAMDGQVISHVQTVA